MKKNNLLTIFAVSLIGAGFVLYRKKGIPKSDSDFSSKMKNNIGTFIPHMRHEYMDGIRNPFTGSETTSLKVPKVKLSLIKRGGVEVDEKGDPIPKETVNSLKQKANSESNISYRFVPNFDYLNAYKNPDLDDVKIERDGDMTFGDLFSPQAVHNQVMYMLSDTKDKSIGESFTPNMSKINKNIDILARLLSKEVGFESGRSAQRNASKSFIDKNNQKIPDEYKTSYSTLGSLGFSREASAVLWCALNRFKMNGSFTDILDMLKKTNWNPTVSNQIASDINNGVAVDSRYTDFVIDFVAGRYPNEIGHRRSFIHYPAMINISKKIPDWALPHNHALYPKTRGGSKTAGGYLIHSAIFTDNTFDSGTAKSIKPYTDPKRS